MVVQCKGSRHQFLDDCELRAMEELVIGGMEAETKKGEPKLGVKTKAVVAIHTYLQLHDHTPPLRNRNRKSNVRIH